jgi:hypothetical protein
MKFEITTAKITKWMIAVNNTAPVILTMIFVYFAGLSLFDLFGYHGVMTSSLGMFLAVIVISLIILATINYLRRQNNG